MSASTPSGSTAPVLVVPATPTTATGVTPAATSVSIARASSSGRMRKRSSQRICRSARRPRPSTSHARAIELCACSEAYTAAEPGSTPCSRAVGSARARAHARPVRLASVPPLVKWPMPAGKPISSASQRQATSSISEASPAPPPRLASSAAASVAAATPASSDEPSMNGNERGWACASERGSTSPATRSIVASRPAPVRGRGVRTRARSSAERTTAAG